MWGELKKMFYFPALCTSPPSPLSFVPGKNKLNLETRDREQGKRTRMGVGRGLRKPSFSLRFFKFRDIVFKTEYHVCFAFI